MYFLLGVLLPGCGKIAGPAMPPRVIVMITVDGLRADLLDRYDAAFTGGFRMLRDRGYRFTNTTVDHAITVSHAGHVTLATGRHPSHHGIVDAAFYSFGTSGRVLVDAVEDSSYSILGMEGVAGASPSKILSDGIADWLRARYPGSRELAVGSGNVSSLLHVFRPEADVYWYRDGRFVTSTYYKRSYPDWVSHFNEVVMPAHLRAMDDWELSVPDSLRSLARPDSSSFEGDLVHTEFPHRISLELPDALARDSAAARAVWIRWTPMIDMSTLALVRQGIVRMDIGQDDETDYVSIVLSTIDSQSHYFGPTSLEVLDILLRIDRALGDFIAFLDERVGKGRYVIALSSDHGFPLIPEIDAAGGGKGRRVGEKEIEAWFSRVSDALGRNGGDEGGRQGAVAGVLRTADFIAAAYTTAALTGKTGTPDPFLPIYRHSYRPDRIPRLPLFSLNSARSPVAREGMMVRLREGAMIDIDRATHGSPYEYDRRVPLIFMGGSIPAGFSEIAARTIDAAPTLAAIAGAALPPDIDGKILEFTK